MYGKDETFLSRNVFRTTLESVTHHSLVMFCIYLRHQFFNLLPYKLILGISKNAAGTLVKLSDFSNILLITRNHDTRLREPAEIIDIKAISIKIIVLAVIAATYCLFCSGH